MQITLEEMRRAVKAWLREEKATKKETLQLLEAVYGGVVDGGSYQGRRDWSAEADSIMEQIRLPNPLIPKVLERGEEGYLVNADCGCLLSTLDALRGNPATGFIEGESAVAFALAYMIPFGATPFNNKWSNAAAEGIVDYYQSRGWK